MLRIEEIRRRFFDGADRLDHYIVREDGSESYIGYQWVPKINNITFGPDVIEKRQVISI